MVAFHIESRPKPKGAFKTVATVPGTAREATLSKLAPNRLFTLRVTAVGADGAARARSQEIQLRPHK